MAWPSPGSAIFTQAALNPILGKFFGTTAPGSFGSWSADTINVALYGGASYAGTPDKDAAVASTGYNTGAWSSAANYEMTGANYAAGGTALGTKAIASATGAVNFTAANPSWSTVTLASCYGDLVYDHTIAAGNTVADQGMCFHSFGGAQSITAGTFTVAWNGGNVMQFTFAYA